MTHARSRKLRGSLGDSWGDADYSSDGGASIHSSSSLSDAGSRSEYELHDDDKEYAREHQDIATPLPPRVTRASSKTPQDTPVKTPASRVVSRHSQTPRSSSRSTQSTPTSGSLGPSFIMPSMSGSVDGFYNGSPLHNSRLRVRKSRRPSMQSQPGSTNSSPRIQNKRGPSANHFQPRPSQGEEEDLGPWHYVDLFRAHVLWPLAQYIIDVFAYAMHHFMKPLLGVALGVFLLIVAIQLSSGFLQKTVRTAIAPLCIIPGSSYALPFCRSASEDAHHPDFENLVKVQSTFEDVVNASKDTHEVSEPMQQSVTAIRELRSLVKYSRVPSRMELEVEFSYFVETAREASDHLISYNVAVGSTLDKVISTNRWTVNMLEGIASNEANIGALPRLLSYLNPLSVFASSSNALDQLVFEQYVRHISKVKDDITTLITKSKALLAILRNLEDRLDIIADIAYRDNVIVGKDRDQLLSQLWTKLGGNRSSKKSYDQSLGLLKEVLRYEKIAVEHVTATLIKLQKIAAELEILRDGVAEPELLGYRSDVPLEWHLEVIGKGVERLKEMRGESLEIEQEAIRRGLGEDMRGDKGLPGRGTPTVYAKSARKK